jgi:hypothetical protein
MFLKAQFDSFFILFLQGLICPSCRSSLPALIRDPPTSIANKTIAAVHCGACDKQQATAKLGIGAGVKLNKRRDANSIRASPPPEVTMSA